MSKKKKEAHPEDAPAGLSEETMGAIEHVEQLLADEPATVEIKAIKPAPKAEAAPEHYRVTRASVYCMDGVINHLAVGSILSVRTHDIGEAMRQGVAMEPCAAPATAPKFD